MSASPKNKIGQGTPILDIMSDPIVDGKWYKDLCHRRLRNHHRPPKQVVHHRPRPPPTPANFYRFQVDTGKNSQSKNGTGAIKIWARCGRDCWAFSPISTDIVGMKTRYLMPKPDDTKATHRQWIQGIQNHRGGVWLAMGQYALKVWHTLEGTVEDLLDYKRATQCLDQGANVRVYNFEYTFVSISSLCDK